MRINERLNDEQLDKLTIVSKVKTSFPFKIGLSIYDNLPYAHIVSKDNIYKGKFIIPSSHPTTIDNIKFVPKDFEYKEKILKWIVQKSIDKLLNYTAENWKHLLSTWNLMNGID